MSVVAHRTVDAMAMREWLLTITPRTPSSRVVVNQDGDVARKILAVLLRSRFRKGSLASMDAEGFEQRHIDRVAARVDRGEPVQLTLVAFPFKVPNPLKVGDRALPDLAELAALRTLEQLRADVRAVYPPGIEFVIIHDGVYIADAFGVPRREACAYADYFRWLLEITGADDFVRCMDLMELLRRHCGEGAGLVARRRDSGRVFPARGRESESAAFHKSLGMLNVRWVRRESLPYVYEQVRGGDPASLTGEAATLHSQVRRSMERYAECDNLLHRFDPRPCAFPEAIHATTKLQQGRLALWLVRRGRSILPWHGVGVLTKSGRIEVRYTAELEAGNKHRPVYLEDETTPFFYEPA